MLVGDHEQTHTISPAHQLAVSCMRSLPGICTVVLFHVILCPHQVGWTPLISAAVNGKIDVVVELISHGADVDIQSNVSQLTH